MTRAHSPFGASSAKRLLACPPSYALTHRLGAPSKSSKYAAEGTLAHSLAEDFLKTGKVVALSVGETRNVDGHDVKIDEDMLEFVSVYTNYVEVLRTIGYEVWLERRVSPDWLWLPKAPPVDLFGTADCVAFDADTKTLLVADLKYGRGVPVEARWNPQLLYYALGAIREISTLMGGAGPKIEHIKTTIIQPRAPHPDGPIRDFTYTLGQVVGWGREVLKPGVHTAVEELNKTYTYGDHCQFCPVRVQCPELQRLAGEKASTAFVEEDMTDEELPELLKVADAIEIWMSSVRTYAHERMLDGHEVPGFKLVAKRAVRRWTAEDEVEGLLTKFGVPAATTHERSLKSPAQILKAVKSNRELSDALNERVTAQSTGTTIAPVNDPRPAVEARRAAADVFDDQDAATEN